MSRRVEGALVELEVGKTREKDVDIKRITLEGGGGRRVSINNTSVSVQVFPLLQRGAQVDAPAVQQPLTAQKLVHLIRPLQRFVSRVEVGPGIL